jgi:hypothetical protein
MCEMSDRTSQKKSDRTFFTADKRGGKKGDRVHCCSKFHGWVGAGLLRLSVSGKIHR